MGRLAEARVQVHVLRAVDGVARARRWILPRLLKGLIAATSAAGVLLTGCSGDGEPKLSNSANALVEARQAYAAGDETKAIELLSASIEAEPSIWAYLDRAKIYATQGNDAAAQSDCDAALGLAPENRDVPWILGELKKPKDKRFQGAFALPPSAKK